MHNGPDVLIKCDEATFDALHGGDACDELRAGRNPHGRVCGQRLRLGWVLERADAECCAVIELALGIVSPHSPHQRWLSGGECVYRSCRPLVIQRQESPLPHMRPQTSLPGSAGPWRMFVGGANGLQIHELQLGIRHTRHKAQLSMMPLPGSNESAHYGRNGIKETLS